MAIKAETDQIKFEQQQSIINSVQLVGNLVDQTDQFTYAPYCQVRGKGIKGSVYQMTKSIFEIIYFNHWNEPLKIGNSKILIKLINLESKNEIKTEIIDQ